MNTEEIVRQQTIEFKKEIERRYANSKHNHTYVFKKMKDYSNDDSLDSLESKTIYDLNTQNSQPKLKKFEPSKSLEKTLPKQSKTNSILIKLLQSKPKEAQTKSQNQKQQKSSFHSGLEQMMNRSTTQRSNGSFYQNKSFNRSTSKNATSRMKTETSALRDTTNILISPKIVKSPTYSKYIHLDSYLNSTKNRQYLRVGQLTNKPKKNFEFNKLTNFSLGN